MRMILPYLNEVIMDIKNKIKKILRPTKFKIVTTILLVIFAVLMFSAFLSRAMYCIECDISRITILLYIVFLLPMGVIEELDAGPHGIFAYLLMLGATIIYFYVFISIIGHFFSFLGNKIFKEKIVTIIKKIVLILVSIILVLVVGYISFSIVDHKLKTKIHVREARSFERTILSQEGVTCEERTTQYEVIEDLEFTYNNILSYAAMVFDPVMEEFVVLEKYELTLNTPRIGFSGIDSNGRLHGVAFDEDGGMLSWKYGERMEHRKPDYDMLKMLREKVKIKSF